MQKLLRKCQRRIKRQVFGWTDHPKTQRTAEQTKLKIENSRSKRKGNEKVFAQRRCSWSPWSAYIKRYSTIKRTWCWHEHTADNWCLHCIGRNPSWIFVAAEFCEDHLISLYWVDFDCTYNHRIVIISKCLSSDGIRKTENSRQMPKHNGKVHNSTTLQFK